MIFICKENQLEKPIEYILSEMTRKNTELILLTGEMGAGKTTFTRNFCERLGTKSIVNSPTYNFMNEYKLEDKEIYHFDLYRIREEEELQEIGFHEMINKPGLKIVEWWNVAKNFIPSDFIEVKISVHSETTRLIEIISGEK